MRIHVQILLVCLLSMGIALSQSKVGTTAASFLNIPSGARSTGMGGASAAIGDDAMAIFTNVAGISNITRNQIAFNTADWFVGSSLNHFAAVLAAGPHVLGLSMKQLDYGSEIVTTESHPEGTGEKWKANDQALGISYARFLTDRFSLGGTFKVISQEIYHESSSSVALDLGLLYRADFRNLRIGMSINNFGLDAKLDGKDLLLAVDIDEVNAGNNDNISAKLETDEWPLPLLFTVGLAMDMLETNSLRWQIAVDALHPNNNNSYLRIGSEIELYHTIFIRMGHSSLMKEYAEDKLSFGAGLQYSVGGMRLGFDYTMTDYGRLGMIPQFGIFLAL